MKSLSSASLANIISLLDSGHSTRHISQQTGVSLGTISKIRSEHCSTLPKASGGRPPKLSENAIRHSVRAITTGKAENAVQVTKMLQDITNQPVSAQTVRRGLKKAGLKAVVKQKKPLLKPRHKAARLDFALRHKDWTLDDWKKVVWSDETKINRLGSDGRKWAWKKKGEGLSERLVDGTLKFGGGSAMVWGCMTWQGIGYTCQIEGKMDAELYCKILEDELQDTLEYYGKDVEDIIFQQDNDPKHTSGKAKHWFQTHGVEVLLWPAQSPDLNPIEHLWDHLKRKLSEYETPSSGVLELWDRIVETWEAIPASVCQNLIESMPRRIEAVLQAKGGHTKY